MNKLRFLSLLPLVALSVGCATLGRAQSTISDAIDMVQGVRSTVTEVLDRPAPLANTERDEQLIRSAYHRFDQGLTIIESLVDRSVITPGSPNALRLAAGVQVVKLRLSQAYAAQRALNTGTVRDALGLARTALDGLVNNLQQEQ